MGALDDRIAIITGAGSGLGRAMALGFADEGASLVLAGRRLDKVDDTARTCRARGARAAATKCDVTDEDSVAALIRKAIDTYGRIDIMVNNAGQGPSQYTDPMPTLSEVDDVEWDRIWTVNLDGPFLCMKHGLPSMTEGGSVINIISISGRHIGTGGGPYPLSKYTLEMMTKMVAAEQKNRGVRVNALCPGIVAESEFWDIANTRPGWAQNAVGPDVIVPAAVFLASGDSSDVTGQAYFGKWFNDQVAATGQPPRQGI